jgi:hypothetical protein
MSRWPVLLLGLALGAAGCREQAEPRAVPLSHSAYVWRQGWDAAARDSLSGRTWPVGLTELNVLVGECGLAPTGRRVHPPWPALRATGRTLALSVRIGTRHALGGSGEPDLSEGLALLRAGWEEARAAGVTVAAVQVDFDCPSRLLDAYADRVVAAKRAWPEVRLTVTTLPTWLKEPGFARLIAAADGWTLQLHGTQRPNLAQPAPLFAAAPALGWIEQAESWGHPFRVALPTYAYLACFSSSGAYLGVRAETAELPKGTARTQVLPADPAEVVRLLEELEDRRHALVQGVDWFRLPFPGDRQNWTMAGWTQVIARQALAKTCTVELKVDGVLADVAVRNATGQPLPLPTLELSWTGARLLGADATGSWVAAARGEGLVFRPDERAGFLAPGERRVVGWVRLTEARPVTVRVAGE